MAQAGGVRHSRQSVSQHRRQSNGASPNKWRRRCDEPAIELFLAPVGAPCNRVEKVGAPPCCMGDRTTASLIVGRGDLSLRLLAYGRLLVLRLLRKWPHPPR